MSEYYFAHDAAAQSLILEVAATSTGRPAYLLEKDIWVVWTLCALFAAPFAGALVFKGGTSLSKVYRAIDRFSEDIDITFDIRQLIPELTAEGVLPDTKSQARRWRTEIETRLYAWVAETGLPYLDRAAKSYDLAVRMSADKDTIYFEYDARADGYGYVPARIKIEFGARSTGLPVEEHSIGCDAAGHVVDTEFPYAPTVRVMRAERTFWEKATAIHVFCLQMRLRAEAFARHWYDLAMLDAAGLADTALADSNLAQEVADHKAIFFIEKAADDTVIDYHAAVHGQLRLVPEGEALDLLADDYAKMVDARLQHDGAALNFDDVIARCRVIETKANCRYTAPPVG
jgi:hypothetical protein